MNIAVPVRAAILDRAAVRRDIRRDRDRRHLSPREARRLERQRDNRRMDRRDRRGDRYEYYR